MKTAISISLLLCAALAGCAIDDKTFDEQGKETHIIHCSNALPSLCYSKANEICPAGYITVEDKMHVTDPFEDRYLSVRCKK
jgi:hypothetical protein